MSDAVWPPDVTVRVYVEPDEGPVLPVELDLTMVEEEAQRVPPSLRNRERLRAMGAQIRARLPGVRPETNPGDLLRLAARFRHAHEMDRFVVHLAGRTEDEAARALSERARALEGEVGSLTAAVSDLGAQLQEAVRALTEAEERAGRVDLRTRRLGEVLAAERVRADEAEHAGRRCRERLAELEHGTGQLRGDRLPP